MPTIEVKVKRNEHVEKSLKRLKRLMDTEGILRELKERQYFVKPGDKRRKKSARARSRAKKEAKEQASTRTGL